MNIKKSFRMAMIINLIAMAIVLIKVTYVKQEKEIINEQYQIEVSSGKYDESYNSDKMINPMTGEVSYRNDSIDNYTQKDIYKLNEGDYNNTYIVPLKSIKMTDKGFDYYYLTDFVGDSYISYDNLIDGGNYIGIVTKVDGECVLKSVMESKFEFDEELIEMYESDKEFYHKDAKEIINNETNGTNKI